MLVVTVAGNPTQVTSGTLVGWLLPERLDGLPVVAALIDQTAMPLTTPLLSNCSVQALTTRTWEGQRVQRRSLMLLALEARKHVRPDVTLRAGPSLGFAQRLIVKRDAATSALASELSQGDILDLATSLEAGMHRLLQEGLALRREHWLLDEAHNYFAHHGLQEAVELL